MQKEAARGMREGADWAHRYATHEKLKRVANIKFGAGESYAWQLDEAIGLDPGHGDSFWINEETGRIDPPSDEYVEAFCNGATDVWDTVKDKI